MLPWRPTLPGRDTACGLQPLQAARVRTWTARTLQEQEQKTEPFRYHGGEGAVWWTVYAAIHRTVVLFQHPLPPALARLHSLDLPTTPARLLSVPLPHFFLFPCFPLNNGQWTGFCPSAWTRERAHILKVGGRGRGLDGPTVRGRRRDLLSHYKDATSLPRGRTTPA